MRSIRAERILAAGAELAEGPLWNEAESRLYWTSILAGEIHRFDPVSGRDESFAVGHLAGSFASTRSGGLVAACEDGFYRLTLKEGRAEARFLCDPGRQRSYQRFNDGKCDPAGRFLAGTIRQGDTPGALYSLAPDGSCTQLLDNISVANGIAFSPDGGTLYYIDSPTRVVMAYDYDPPSGCLGAGRVCVEIADGEAVPDGMTVDENGNLWIALWLGWKVVCHEPRGGKRLAEIPLPVARVSSCAFGGSDYRTLFITTAWERTDAAERAAQPMAGDLFAADPDARGLPPHHYGG